jgi:U4/U6 small nuclear ribonucleoprotein PRP3
LESAKTANPDAMDLELTDDDRKKILSDRDSRVQGLQENTDYFYELLGKVKGQVFNDRFLYEIVKEKDFDIDLSIFTPATTEAVIQTRLTEKEKKTLRRERRTEYQKEIQEKIKYGLMPPPPPKVKMSNFMKIMNSEATQDPTKVEKEVRAVIQDRQDRHKDRNQARKLTKDQKNDKFMKKIKRDAAKDCKVCIFKFKSLYDHKIRNKINRNAEDLALNGFCITPDKRLAGHLPGIVAIEGGPKYTKFFKKLLLNRLKWDDSKDIKKHDTLGENFNDEKMVQLVWEGSVKDRLFPKWTSIEMKSELDGRKLFADRGV